MTPSLVAHSAELETTSDLQRQIPAEEVNILKHLEQEFLTLELKNMTSFSKGTVVLIPDWSQHAASPRAINYLRHALIDYGWNTIAMMVPTPLPSLSNDALVAYQTDFQGRLTEVLKRAAAQPGNVIIVAQGSSGALITLMLQRKELTEPQGLVLLSAHLQDVQMNQSVALSISQHQVPTLDIMHQQDNPFVEHTSQRRLQLTRKHMKELYRQRILAGTIDDDPSWLFKEIYGWLTFVGY